MALQAIKPCRGRPRHTACMPFHLASMTRPRDIDLVVVFRANAPSIHISKQKARQEAQEAEDQYSHLLDTLRRAGLYAVGRRGEHQGQLIILLSCSGRQLHLLLQRERQDPSFPSNSFFLLTLSFPQSFGRSSWPLHMCFRYRRKFPKICRAPAPRARLCYRQPFRRRPRHTSRQRCMASRRINHGPSRPRI